MSLTVKRVSGGRVSNYLNDRVEPGMLLEVRGPSGSFTAEGASGAVRHLLMVAGGSGITPLMSMVRTVLVTEPNTSVSLIYGNHRQQDILFREALEALAREHAQRFRLRLVLSEAPPEWRGGVGLLNRYVLEDEFSVMPGLDAGPVTGFICGPEPMLVEARAALRSWGVKPERIREERFSQPHLRQHPEPAPEAQAPQPVEFRLRGMEPRRILAPAGMTVLEAGLSAGLPLLYSCTIGGCGSCRLRLRAGEVRMEEPNCLWPEERPRGHVLACISRPLSPVVVEDLRYTQEPTEPSQG